MAQSTEQKLLSKFHGKGRHPASDGSPHDGKPSRLDVVRATTSGSARRGDANPTPRNLASNVP